MTPLPLPTDNLYKFCAITGIVIIGFSIFYFDKIVRDLVDRREEIQLAIEKAKIEISGEESQAISTVASVGKDGQIHVTQTIRLQVLEIDDRKKKAAQLLSRETWTERGTIGSLIFGVMMSVFGFVKWWGIQRLQDKILRAEAAKYS